MTAYRAKLIIERVERTSALRRRETVPAEAIYDEIRIEVTATSPDVALSKLINLATAEQTDRDARSLMPGNQNASPTNCPGVPHRGHTKSGTSCPLDREEEDDEDEVEV